MHPLYDALTVPYVSVRVTCGAMVAHRYIISLLAAGPGRPQDFYPPLSISVNYIGDPVFDGAGLEGFKRRANVFLLGLAARALLSYAIFSFSSLFENNNNDNNNNNQLYT